MKSWLKFGVIFAIIGFIILSLSESNFYGEGSLESILYNIFFWIIIFFVTGILIGFVIDYKILKNYQKGGMIGVILFIFISLFRNDLYYKIINDLELINNSFDYVLGYHFDIYGAGGLLILFIIVGTLIGLTFKEAKKK